VTADVALLKLAAPLPPAYTPVALADAKIVAAGSQVIVAGYGVTVVGNERTGGTLRAANTTGDNAAQSSLGCSGYRPLQSEAFC
jgi:hypothetical protein